MIRNVDIHKLAANAGFPLNEEDGLEMMVVKGKRRASRSPGKSDDTEVEEGKGGKAERKPSKKAQGERRRRGPGRGGKKPEGVELVEGTWNNSAVKKAQSKSRTAGKGKDGKRDTKKARMNSSEEYESQGEEEDEAEYTEDQSWSK